MNLRGMKQQLVDQNQKTTKLAQRPPVRRESLEETC